MRPKAIKGVNLGGWLLMEGYIMGGRNIPESEFKYRFKQVYGRRELGLLEREFRDNFITDDDLRIISSWGANCIRVPFHYKIFEKRPCRYSRESLLFIQRFLRKAGRCGLKVILDLHAACGGQNEDWHSDSGGKALLWRDSSFRKRTCALWGYLADRLKDEEALYGYDLLNEPVLPEEKAAALKAFYAQIIKSIREADRKKIIFLEGNTWAQEIDFLKDLAGEKIAVSIHSYRPLSFLFNFRRGYTYPGTIENARWDINMLKRLLEPYMRFASRYKTDIYVGEFGVNYRGNRYGELIWLGDILNVFEEFGFGWAYWTYKAVSNSVFPDGIVQYLDNPAWINRQGPVYGLENYYKEWGRNKRKIVDSWKTRRFCINTDIVKILKRHFER